MKYSIKVKTNAKQNEVKDDGSGALIVSVKTPPIEGRANTAVIETLAKYFGVSKRNVAIVSGFKSKLKLIRVGCCDC